MKYLAHIPTEQYGFISVELEGTAAEAVAAYREVSEEVKVQPESKISMAEFAEIGEEYLETGKLANGGDLEFNPSQKYVLKLITKIVRKRDN